MTEIDQKGAQEIKRSLRQRRQKKSANMIRTVLVWIVGGLVLLLILSWLGRRAEVATEVSYQPEDIVYGDGIEAVHEMGGASLSSIQFLPEDGPQPKIAVSETFFDFGDIGSAEVVQHEFVVANLGEAPLSISRAYTTCGCTTATISASEIPPGKVALITLILDAGFHDVRGQTVKRGLIIENNDPRNPELVLWTQANVAATP